MPRMMAVLKAMMERALPSLILWTILSVTLHAGRRVQSRTQWPGLPRRSAALAEMMLRERLVQMKVVPVVGCQLLDLVLGVGHAIAFAANNAIAPCRQHLLVPMHMHDEHGACGKARNALGLWDFLLYL